MMIDKLKRPMRDLRVSVVDACNFRCTYCMPRDLFGDGYPFLTADRLLSIEQIVQVAEAAVALGVVKIKLTGGEPLLRPGLGELIASLAALEGLEDLGLITNGFHLKEMGAALKAAGLPRITISLDTLRPATFEQMNGRRASDHARVMAGIEEALRLKFSDIKVNMVVQRGVNHDQVAEMARFFRGTGATLRFIEYMDVGFKHRFDASLLVPSCETLAALSEHWSLRPADPHYRGEVARRYVYEDGQGEVGFISSMTQPFCSDCTRLRLTADGKLFGCLFAARGLDIKPYLKSVRDQAGLREAMIAFWRGREDRYSELRGAVTPAKKKVEMYRMGG